MKRSLFFILLSTLLACSSNSNELMEPVTSSFQQKRHDAALDERVQPLLNQYFVVMAHLQEGDSTNLQSFGANLIQEADTLIQQKLSFDTATQTNAVQGLMNIQSEMEAILMESSLDERLFGAQMLSLHCIELLTSIGYQKQTIYIFSDAAGNRWIGLNKRSRNPYQQDDTLSYQASQVLQELK
jgi:hypothetical protein